MHDFQYEEGRNVKLEKEVFYRINPRYSRMDNSICLILAGNISGSGHTGSPEDTDFSTDFIGSVATSSYVIRGVGFPLDPYEDTLRNCKEVWIPIPTMDDRVRFKVKKKTSYRKWIYLWNYSEDNDAIISGSIVAGSINLAEDPYTEYPDSNRKPELDYSCSIEGPDRSIIFVTYEPKNFRYNGTYNATLNNALSESNANLYSTVSGSEKWKNVISDDHTIEGGREAGEIVLGQSTGSVGTEATITREYIYGFSASADKYAGDMTLQTLDLGFLSYRAISASIYVDRINSDISASIEKVWDDIQEGNTDDPETVYFIPRCTMSFDSSSKKESESDEEYEERMKRLKKLSYIYTTTIPRIGDILFTVNQHTPARHIEATLYAPFLNRVYRTDKFGAVIEEFPQSDFPDSENAEV